MNCAPSSHRHPAADGFSLLELLVTVMIIGLLGAIALPSIGDLSSGAKDTSARRNAQLIAATAAQAQAAGYRFTDGLSGADTHSVYTELRNGVSPPKGAFAGRKFIVPNLPPVDDSEAQRILRFLNWDAANKTLAYNASMAGQ